MMFKILVLGVSRRTSKEEIHKAYLKLAMANHPDIHGAEQSDKYLEIQDRNLTKFLCSFQDEVFAVHNGQRSFEFLIRVFSGNTEKAFQTFFCVEEMN